jgi:hypothetical protein
MCTGICRSRTFEEDRESRLKVTKSKWRICFNQTVNVMNFFRRNRNLIKNPCHQRKLFLCIILYLIPVLYSYKSVVIYGMSVAHVKHISRWIFVCWFASAQPVTYLLCTVQYTVRQFVSIYALLFIQTFSTGTWIFPYKNLFEIGHLSRNKIFPRHSTILFSKYSKNRSLFMDCTFCKKNVPFIYPSIKNTFENYCLKV